MEFIVRTGFQSSLWAEGVRVRAGEWTGKVRNQEDARRALGRVFGHAWEMPRSVLEGNHSRK